MQILKVISHILQQYITLQIASIYLFIYIYIYIYI